MTRREALSETGIDPAELARLRQTAYRLFGAALLRPDGELTTTLAPLGRVLKGETRPFERFAFWGEWTRFLTALGALGTVDALTAAWSRLFGPTASGARCAAHESAWVPPGVDTAVVVAAVTTAYRYAGLAVVPSFGEFPDHVATELEFMGLLCREEARAWERDRLPEALAWLKRQADFLDQHLGRWLPRFAERVGREDDGFFRVAASAAWAFVAHDRGLIAALRAGLAEAAA